MLDFTLCHNVLRHFGPLKAKSFEHHWLHALAMFDVTSFPAILCLIGVSENCLFTIEFCVGGQGCIFITFNYKVDFSSPHLTLNVVIILGFVDAG